MSILFIGGSDYALNNVGRGERPENKSFQKSKLHRNVSSRMRNFLDGLHTLSVGDMLVKVAPPDSGFFPAQLFAHCVLWFETASSRALL